ncbi:methyl-accepting chemotaxis protein [Paenibacillus sp. JCM 10914]|uniref:methyl-accepting chemotaxis protein n=1 Tax=Paenibacillus sp. JCM 10914 TaxID=1236974 RepID=UPI0003CC75A7|nr:methyl-accepting chemotaxis protein [Paenibacillus sp. JCM 10914]GAE08378.1 methyl-accepting chemotaxis protein [Paenibacillus sp. JCM 10914]
MNMEMLQQRNKLLSKLLWFSLALGLIVEIATGQSIDKIMILLSTGIVIIGLITVLSWKRLFSRYIQYLVVLALGILSFLIIYSTHTLTTYLLVYYSLALITLYNNARAILLSGLIGVILTNVFYAIYPDTMFAVYKLDALLTFNLFLGLVTLILAYRPD